MLFIIGFVMGYALVGLLLARHYQAKLIKDQHEKQLILMMLIKQALAGKAPPIVTG
jgi:positive regulator of sigma E activity